MRPAETSGESMDYVEYDGLGLAELVKRRETTPL